MMRLLITDMDGTIIDSMPFLTELAVALVAADGHSEDLIRELYAKTVGLPINEQFHQFNLAHPLIKPLDVLKLTQLYESIHKIAAKNFHSTDFGATLAACRWAVFPEWRLALVTSTHRSIVDGMPQLGHIPWNFIGGRTVKGTGKKGQIMTCLDEMGLTANDAVYVGDTISDQELADSMHIPFFFPYSGVLHHILGSPEIRDPTLDHPTPYGTVRA